jgi:hypothetical protein
VYGVEAQPLPAASNSPPPGISPTLTSTLIAGHISWDARFSSGIDSQYQINTSYYNASDNYSFDSQPWPYSTQYDFSNGVVSRAGFDLQGNQLVASSQFAALFGFDPSAPGVVNGPSFLPQDLGAISPLTGLAIEPEIDTLFTTPDVLARVRLPFAGFEAYTVAAVPEPSSLALLATGATLVLFMAWTRRRGGRQACPSWQPMWAMSGRRWLRRTGRSSCPLIPLEPWRAR